MDAHIACRCGVGEYVCKCVNSLLWRQAVIKFLLPLAVLLCRPPGCRQVKGKRRFSCHSHRRSQTGTHTHALTGPALDASLGAGHGEDGEAVVVLGASGLDGANVAVAAGAEHTRKIQGLHGLRLHLPEHGLTHCLELTVQCVSQLEERNEGARV